ncbi:VPLPA-CTERM sorting domain-containing protein [Antarctobacter jejuensis]|uniref:VPLPA-CTERM sorting domain-containing protein n=1 Tax=Antarctobacter jejuensis TaxID=1439938 RepID=UPI003FCF3E44
MKRSLIAICAGVLSLASVQSADAASILRYFDSYGGVSDGVVGTALSDLGETATAASHSDLATSLSSQAWDLLIIDIPGSNISAANAAAIDSFISGGGSAILSYWNLDTLPALASSFDVSVASSFNSVQSVFAWDTGSPAAGNLLAGIDFTDQAGDNGDMLDAINGATAVAGYSPVPAPGQGAIVIGNGGRTIANGFLFWDMGTSPTSASVALVKGQIDSLLSGTSVSPVPVPASLPLLLGGLAAFGMIRRKRKTA